MLIDKRNGFTKKIFCIGFGLALLVGCSSNPQKDNDGGPSKPVDWRKVKPVIPKSEPKSAYGNPESYEVYGVTYHILDSAENFKQEGVASWYGSMFHGRRTSSGETYDMLQLTAAHKTLPIPCYVKVINKDNGKSIVVRVNDRGPFVKSRIIDLSYVAAHKLGMTEKGTANVSIEAINFENINSKSKKLTINQTSKRFTKKASSSLIPKTRNNKVNPPPPLAKPRFVQVGAYSIPKSAKKLAAVLDKEIKLPVKISSVIRQGKKLFRVRIGPIESLEIAEQLTKALNITELGKPSIVYQD